MKQLSCTLRAGFFILIKGGQILRKTSYYADILAVRVLCGFA